MIGGKMNLMGKKNCSDNKANHKEAANEGYTSQLFQTEEVEGRFRFTIHNKRI
jgi:hypothetical protein